MFGHECETGPNFVPMAGSEGCNWPTYKLESTAIINSTTRSSAYRLIVDKSNPPGGAVIMRISFSTEISLEQVSFSAEVQRPAVL